uniref:Uncharacterized protein n=1 Tax=Rhizophora mucronata TaxID=61149 RepID=A0A2P2IKH0_RHIMU
MKMNQNFWGSVCSLELVSCR